jgi:hypothetical protein
MKISPYTSYLELQPNALLVRQNFYYLQKLGVTETTMAKNKSKISSCHHRHFTEHLTGVFKKQPFESD